MHREICVRGFSGTSIFFINPDNGKYILQEKTKMLRFFSLLPISLLFEKMLTICSNNSATLNKMPAMPIYGGKTHMVVKHLKIFGL